jgi:hypothetical protein
MAGFFVGREVMAGRKIRIASTSRKLTKIEQERELGGKKWKGNDQSLE